MQDDLAKLQGTWHILTIEAEGQSTPAGSEAKIVIEGDHFTSLGMGATYKGKLSVNAAQRPKTFDLKFTSGPEKGNTNLGIYELKGDHWKICLDIQGKNRPGDFAAEPGSGRVVEVLGREPGAWRAKKETAIAIDDLPANPAPELEGEWEMLSCVQNGEALPKAWVEFGRRVTRGNLITVTMNGQVMMKVRFTVDRTEQPSNIDYLVASGPASGQRQYGIYTFDGKTLTTCIAALGNPRPTDFSAARGDGKLLTSWRRLKP